MSAASGWRPCVSGERLRQRAELLQRLRAFMQRRGVLEVETPVLGHYGNPDPNLAGFTTDYGTGQGDKQRLFLHTSPEFPMKRLLAAGSGPIYQICKVFRNGEQGLLHEPEFSMLEWYRPGFDQHALMDEIGELLRELALPLPERRPYAALFRDHTGLDPHTATDAQLLQAAHSLGLQAQDQDRPLLLDFLFSHRVIPALESAPACFVHDFPVEQAALARLRRDGGVCVAERFELFINGLEIANGYHELCDADEQQARFEAENRRRAALGLPGIEADPRLLAALASGLPDCAGVALGVDRLFMAISGAGTLSETLSFTLEHN